MEVTPMRAEQQSSCPADQVPCGFIAATDLWHSLVVPRSDVDIKISIGCSEKPQLSPSPRAVWPCARLRHSLHPSWHASSKFINAWGDDSASPSAWQTLGLCHFPKRLHTHPTTTPVLGGISLCLFSSTLTRKVKSAWAVVRFNPQTVDDVQFFFSFPFFQKAFLSSTGGAREMGELCAFVCP